MSTGSGESAAPHNILNMEPGASVVLSAMRAAIDPVGTMLPDDFDGDGILNANETTTNIWVADYPQIDSFIATPVTMKIEILKTSGEVDSEIVSEINSGDFESTKNQGTEKIHRNEVNERRTKVTTSTQVKPNAGYVRAGLYIKNHSVNMPVRISNVLCSLMFETPRGQLIPVQSFRLRNDDVYLRRLR